MNDPTYDVKAIEAIPSWKLAFFISEWINDNAPIGWFRYNQVAEAILDSYEEKAK